MLDRFEKEIQERERLEREKVRNGWNLGFTINANENILKDLADLITTETF